MGLSASLQLLVMMISCSFMTLHASCSFPHRVAPTFLILMDSILSGKELAFILQQVCVCVNSHRHLPWALSLVLQRWLHLLETQCAAQYWADWRWFCRMVLNRWRDGSLTCRLCPHTVCVPCLVCWCLSEFVSFIHLCGGESVSVRVYCRRASVC